MSVSRRALSAVLRLFYRSHSVAQLVGLVLAIVAFMRLVSVGWQEASLWGVPAVLGLLGGWLADRNGFMLFTAAEGVGQLQPLRPGVYRALASGVFLQKHWTGLRMHAMVSGEGVQLRWMVESKPPCLAILQPWEISAGAFSLPEAAERYALWHPGSEVRLGWVAVGWDVFPGIELRFIGRRLLLAFDEEEHARAVADLLRSAA